MNYKIVFSKRATKDYELIKKSPLSKKAKAILLILENNPYEPPLEELSGNLKGVYSKRLNIQHRIVYQIHNDIKTVKLLAMWSHYEGL